MAKQEITLRKRVVHDTETNMVYRILGDEHDLEPIEESQEILANEAVASDCDTLEIAVATVTVHPATPVRLDSYDGWALVLVTTEGPQDILVFFESQATYSQVMRTKSVHEGEIKVVEVRGISFKFDA